MKRLIIICEGQTEKEFCETLLQPFFNEHDIDISAPLIKHSNGGIVQWPMLKKQITNHLYQERSAWVTTLFDYYGLKADLHFPEWEESEMCMDKNEKAAILERAMKADIEESIRYRFIPYIQLHEFEGLLFNNVKTFEEVIPPHQLVGKDELIAALDSFDNPEMINDTKETSPSHRLARIISGYNKVVYGNYLAESIGLNRIMAKCPRFRQWIQGLIEVVQQ